MKFFQVSPEIHGFNTFDEFLEEFEVSSKDVILTNRVIFEPLQEKSKIDCPVIYSEDYGTSEPTDEMVQAMMDKIDTYDYDRLIAVGGGAVLDTAKLLVLERTGSIDFLYENPQENVKKAKTLICVPTTAGTGSEVTNVAVMIRTKMDLKMGIQTQDMFCDYAVLIPELLDTVGYELFTHTTVDALIHSVEAYISKNATPFTDLLAEHAIELILEGYMDIRDNGKDVRFERNNEYLLASTYAGLSFGTAGCGTVHACSFAFGGKYDVPHGEACYQFFIETLRFFQRNNPDGNISKLNNYLSSIFDCEDGLGALDDLLDAVAPLEKMSAYGAVEADIKPFAKATYENQQRLLKNNEYPVDEKDLEEIFRLRL